MKRKPFTIIFALALLFSAAFVNAHTYRIPLVADTDMALDDIRTLVMLLNSDMADIRLIVSSDGAASPQAGCKNIWLLINYFNMKDIELGAGRALNKPAPSWRLLSENLNWPEPVPVFEHSFLPAVQAISKTMNKIDHKVIYLCLGSLTNLADVLRAEPSVKEKISKVIFFGGLPSDSDPGWNYKRDPESAEFVFKSGLDICSIHISRKDLLVFDQKFYDRIKSIDTPAARIITELHNKPEIRKLIAKRHFRVWDEMTAAYLNRPSLFKFVPTPGNPHIMTLESFQTDELREACLKLLGHSADSHLDTRRAVVLNGFPDDPSRFRQDLEPYVEKIIQKYGFEEWKACILTSEFHRHLGIYSVIGAKMGIRAREILEAPFDTLEVISLAGNKPPLSCMNDGLQVSTGASLGRGAITISEENPRPACVFKHRGQSLTLKIKKKIADKIKSDIESALKKYGGINPEYFAHIRKLSITYWHDFDRKRIFEEVK